VWRVAILWPPLDESMYGKAPMHMTACEEERSACWAMCSWEEMMSTVVLLNKVRK